MKLLYIQQYFTTKETAYSTRSYELATRFKTAGWDVDVISTSAWLAPSVKEKIKDGKLDVEGVNVYIANIKYKRLMSYPRRIASWLFFLVWATIKGILVKRPDVVFASSTPLTVVVPGILASLWHRCPLVFEIRDVWPDQLEELGILKNKLLLKVVHFAALTGYNHAKAIITLSTGMKDQILTHGIDENKIEVITNCSDNHMFSPSLSGNEFRKKHGLENNFVLLYAGAIQMTMGLDYVIDAAAAIKDKDEKIKFVFIGDGTEKGNLMKKTEKLGLDKVLFLEPEPKSNMPDIIAAADITIMSVYNNKAMWMNSANKFFDYLAAGKPVIINYGGWQKEVLDEYEAGIAADQNDPKDMGRAILKLKNDPELIKKMEINARKLAEEKYDRTMLMNELIGLVENVAKSAKSK
jgi:glycosyltransferase involved in cell wall biosynthesis